MSALMRLEENREARQRQGEGALVDFSRALPLLQYIKLNIYDFDYPPHLYVSKAPPSSLSAQAGHVNRDVIWTVLSGIRLLFRLFSTGARLIFGSRSGSEILCPRRSNL